MNKSKCCEINYDCQTFIENFRELARDIRTNCTQYFCFEDIKKIFSDICCPIKKSNFKKKILRNGCKRSETIKGASPKIPSNSLKKLPVKTILIHPKGLNISENNKMNDPIPHSQSSTEQVNSSYKIQNKYVNYYKNPYDKTINTRPSLFKLASLKISSNATNNENKNINANINSNSNDNNNSE